MSEVHFNLKFMYMDNVPFPKEWKGPIYSQLYLIESNHSERSFNMMIAYTNYRPSKMLRIFLWKVLFGVLGQEELKVFYVRFRSDVYSELILKFFEEKLKNNLSHSEIRFRIVLILKLLGQQPLDRSTYKSSKLRLTLYQIERQMRKVTRQNNYMSFSYSEGKRKLLSRPEPEPNSMTDDFVLKERIDILFASLSVR